MTDTEEIEKRVIGLRIEAALIPDWYTIVLELASSWCIRMCTIEKPEEYVVQIELETAKVQGFQEALSEAWAGFVAGKKKDGAWEPSETEDSEGEGV